MNSINNGTMAAMAAALAANSNLSSDKAEMRLYLDRLKAMVPQCPKNRKVSRQELIEHVINYISDLQDTLHSDSDSESESPIGSPTNDFSFSDSFTQHAHYSTYHQQHHFDTSLKHQPQYSEYGMQTHQYSQYGEADSMMMEDSHATTNYNMYYGSSASSYLSSHSSQSMETDGYGFRY